ncbi:MAG: glutathione peroxidase [Pseudomonadota bacterium]
MQLILALLMTAAGSGDCNLLDHDFRKLAADESVNLCEDYSGQVLLVVNTASKCGNTPQYDGLEAMYKKYRDQGFAVLGFPSNDFMGQEPGTEDQIAEFCRLTYGVQFPMFEKTTVKGAAQHPFFAQLTEAGQAPQWNFQKYLIDREGKLIQVFSPRTQPEDEALVEAIETAIGG